MREYATRFNKATLGIKDIQMSSVVTTLVNGLRINRFKTFLSKRPIETKIELLSREEYIDYEEVLGDYQRNILKGGRL